MVRAPIRPPSAQVLTRALWVTGVMVAMATASRPSLAVGYSVIPYVDASQLDDLPPWALSHYKQPWRAWLDAVPGVQFREGLGINYQVPTYHDAVIRMLAEHGFRTIRLEIGGSNLDWDMRLRADRRAFYDAILTACRRCEVRPLILLNNHQGVPCPVKWLWRKVVTGAEPGERTVQLDSVDEIVPGRTGISGLTAYWAAEAMITACDPATNTVTLGKPLPIALAAGSSVCLNTLKWLPLSEVGTPEFEETAAYWVQYAHTVCQFVASYGIPFDIEIWNELTFGSRFLDINNYYDPPIVSQTHDLYRQGGRCWEVARGIVELVTHKWPETKCIWGFSNTTFFHTAISTLPPGTDGQSYHPYGTAPRHFPQDEYMAWDPWRNLEGYVPHYRRIMPEGWAHDAIQLESLMRLLNPTARQAAPPGTVLFQHYITEHGWAPSESDVTDVAWARQLKARMVLRASLFWLNKGITKLYFTCAYDENPLGMGLLDPRLLERRPRPGPGLRRFATPALRALGNVTRAFARSRSLQRVRRLGVDVTKLSEPVAAFPGDVAHDPLWHREVFAVLPYQTQDTEFIVALYVMTRDFTQEMEPELYRVTFHNVLGTRAAIRYYDPIQNRPAPAYIESFGPDFLTVRCWATDYPRLLMIREHSRRRLPLPQGPGRGIVPATR